jgi:hypothetical protein
VVINELQQVKSDNIDHIGGYAVALPILSGIETKFGLMLPKFEIKQPTQPLRRKLPTPRVPTPPPSKRKS